MATDLDYILYIHEQAGLGDELSHRKMFGEYALYLRGRVIAFVCDNQVFLKPNAPARQLLGDVTEGPPYPGAKLYWVIDEVLDDAELLRRVLLVTAEALPLPPPKKSKATSSKKPRKSIKKKSGVRKSKTAGS